MMYLMSKLPDLSVWIHVFTFTCLQRNIEFCFVLVSYKGFCNPLHKLNILNERFRGLLERKGKVSFLMLFYNIGPLGREGMI